ncbi:hypothetical protein DPSP01_009418 [Paraphaeosphaeria sporulosa]|uniref:Oxidoreductase-like domain-containing protein n=1 Tax=Paraphaeosphaeria sporulosa TaxID=1460663 RepID=A0A177CM30_9PLEO|nr:uncharacterized protein CC84DRAFT_1257192 [Paraphaeosphaeria sporulosa]OAG08311.1 hypothetical protein CC84DRAFT_1257192 [Paraphaeosphaeria sporulosa]
MEQLGRSARPLALYRSLCASCCPTTPRKSLQLGSERPGLQNSDRIQRRFKGYIAPPGHQAYPIEGYYAEILKKPVSKSSPAPRTATSPPPPAWEWLPKTGEEETLTRASKFFGSVAGPEERRKEIDAASHEIAGVIVPPKPEEPDNCCMSGCVNCVWDMYRDEMEEWAAKSTEARARMQAQRERGQGSGSIIAGKDTPTHIATSMDDDGGGSETNWVAPASQDALFDNIPVGIREFMRTEKKLKERQKGRAAAA